MPKAEIAIEGSYFRLVGSSQARGRTGGSTRGVVMGFSRQARKRLLDRLNQIKCLYLRSGVFVTLTYPDLFPDDLKRWKRDLDCFWQRLKRKYPKVAAAWRLEWKVRRSGTNKGKLAPHFHLLVLNVPLLDRKWLARAWYEVVGSGDPRHLTAGTQAKRVRSRRGVIYDVSKYLGQEAKSYPGWTGRVWGIKGHKNLPVQLLAINLTWRQWYRLRRVLRQWLEQVLGRRLSWARIRGQGLTAYLDHGEVARLLAWCVTSGP